MALSPCQRCMRHVRTTDEGCPFCGSTETRPLAKTPRRTTKRLSRAAMLLAGAVLASGCGSSDPEYALYGGPPDQEPPPETSSPDVDPAAENVDPDPDPDPDPAVDDDLEAVEAEPPADIYGGPPPPAD